MKLIILGKTYTIEEVPLKQLKANGICDFSCQTIKVATPLLPDEAKDVILHEVIHAVDHLLDLELTERQVQVLATGLMAVFAANPDFYGRFLS